MGTIPSAFGNLPASSGILANHQHVAVQQSQLNSLSLPLHLIQMLNFDENRPQTYDYASPEFASSTVHSFRAFDRSLISEGRDPMEVLGEPEIDVRPFFQKGNYDINRHTPSTFGPWFVEAYPSMELPTRIGAAIMVTCLLRVSLGSKGVDNRMTYALSSGKYIPHWRITSPCQNGCARLERRCSCRTCRRMISCLGELLVSLSFVPLSTLRPNSHLGPKSAIS